MANTGMQTELLEETATKIKCLRNYRVVLIDDDYHTYNYVVEMLCHVCDMKKEQAFRCAVEVDVAGRTIVYYSTEEMCHTIAKKIKAYGADHRMPRSTSGMNANVECCS